MRLRRRCGRVRGVRRRTSPTGRPSPAHHEDDFVLLLCERLLVDLRVELVAPLRSEARRARRSSQTSFGDICEFSQLLTRSLGTHPQPARLATPALDTLGDERPVAGPVLCDELLQELILLRGAEGGPRMSAGGTAGWLSISACKAPRCSELETPRLRSEGPESRPGHARRSRAAIRAPGSCVQGLPQPPRGVSLASVSLLRSQARARRAREAPPRG